MYTKERPRFTRTTRFRILVTAITFTIILAIVIPISVFFVKKQQRTKNVAPKSNVLVPLYVYPAPGAWAPLHNV